MFTLPARRGAAPIEPGSVLGGRFQIDRLVGRGGMGVVYAARHLVTGRQVALKVIRFAGEASAEQVRRFLREAKAATAIQHPNVIEVLDVFESDDGAPVMVMELLSGETLTSLQKSRGVLELGEAAEILVPVLKAIRAAHAKGIVHRDLKPDNIFMARGPGGELVPKVLDFGIAKILDPSKIAAGTQGGSTETAAVLGTPHYMSYEQAMGEKTLDHRADIWSIGCILYELLTGRRPVEFDNLGQMYRAFITGRVGTIREAMPAVPATVADIIDLCLQKEPEARLGDLGTLIDALEPIAQQRMGSSTLPPAGQVDASAAASLPRGRAPFRRAAWLMGAPLLIAALGGIWAVFARADRGALVAAEASFIEMLSLPPAGMEVSAPIAPEQAVPPSVGGPPAGRDNAPPAGSAEQSPSSVGARSSSDGKGKRPAPSTSVRKAEPPPATEDPAQPTREEPSRWIVEKSPI